MTRLDPAPAPRNRVAFFSAVPAEARGVLFIDLAQISANWKALSDHVAPAHCAAVVKADAYGLGAERVIPALAAAGCRVLFVATLAEARQARALAPDTVVYVLDGVPAGTAPACADAEVWPILSSAPEVAEWAAETGRRGTRLPCGLHIDTGLNRLGLSAAEIDDLSADMSQLAQLDIRLVMSHLACADEPDHPMNSRQRETMLALKSLLPDAPASLAASDGIMLGPPFHFDLVRPGYALYGGQASRTRPAPVGPVVEAYARVLQVRDVMPAETVGYSAVFRADSPRRIAIIAAGYADGFFRHLSGTSQGPAGHVAFAGRLAPVVGRVSMDLITVDVTDLSGPSVTRGEWAEIIGPTISLETFGSAAGSIGYEALTRLGRRFHRVYLGSAGGV